MKWAERADAVYVTFDVADARDVAVAIETRALTFRCKSARESDDGEGYEERIEFFDDIDVERSTYGTNARNVFCSLMKREAKWWSRLTPTNAKKLPNLKVDFDKWASEDDDEVKDVDTSGFDMQRMMGAMGRGGGGGGGMDFASMMGGGGGGAGGMDFASMMGGGDGGSSLGGEKEPSMDELKKLIASMKGKGKDGLGSIDERDEDDGDEADSDDLPELE